VDPSAAMLRRALVGLEAGQVPADVARWLGSGLRSYLSGEAEGLDDALGLKCRQGYWTDRPAVAAELQRRDSDLRATANLLDLPPWAAAQIIADMVAGETVDDRRLVRSMVQRLRTNPRMPISVRQIMRVLNGVRC